MDTEKKSSEYVFSRRNSKGEVKLKRFTGESYETVIEFLEKTKLKYELHIKASMIKIYLYSREIHYYYTTGRWGSPKRGSGLPEKHYRANGIQELYEKYLKDKVENWITESSSIENCLDKDVVEILDNYCDEVIAWGHRLFSKLTSEAFLEFKKNNDIEYFQGTWHKVIKRLTQEEAIKKYGEITQEEIGKQGGWKSIIFGSTKFANKAMASKNK